jgi:hypothetical protein
MYISIRKNLVVHSQPCLACGFEPGFMLLTVNSMSHGKKRRTKRELECFVCGVTESVRISSNLDIGKKRNA